MTQALMTLEECIDEITTQSNELQELINESRFVELPGMILSLQDTIERKCGVLVPKWQEKSIRQISWAVYSDSVMRRTCNQVTPQFCRETKTRVYQLRKECDRLGKEGLQINVNESGGIQSLDGYSGALEVAEIIEARIQYAVLRSIEFLDQKVMINFVDPSEREHMERTWENFIHNTFDSDIGDGFLSSFETEITIYYYELREAEKPKNFSDLVGSYLLARKQKLELREIIGILTYFRSQGRISEKEYATVIGSILNKYGELDLGHRIGREAIQACI